ncbi:hypothetical protein ACEQPO_19175 [Bacillus sp. SL00103]
MRNNVSGTELLDRAFVVMMILEMEKFCCGETDFKQKRKIQI